MADRFNCYPLMQFAGTVAACMDFPLHEQYAPPVDWVVTLMKEKLGGPADRLVLYHADAIGNFLFSQYPEYFAPVQRHFPISVPFVSTIESVTPVAHASMYTGMSPDGHGIKTYTRPVLTCDTLYDRLIAAGKKPCICATAGGTFHHIFNERPMEYVKGINGTEVLAKTLELIEEDKYDVISIHDCDYDDAAHAYGPESKEAKNALSLMCERFDAMAEKIKEIYAPRGHKTLLTFSPDHGQHATLSGKGTHGSTCMEDMNILHFFAAL